jgi:hypothetical protein
MTTRLFALVVALAVVSAPVALEVCQITCESKAMTATMPHAEGHAGQHPMPADAPPCHEHGGTGPQLAPSSIPCDHGVQATPSVVAAKNSDAAISLPAVVSVSYSMAAVETRDINSQRESACAHRLAVPLAVPLRV